MESKSGKGSVALLLFPGLFRRLILLSFYDTLRLAMKFWMVILSLCIVAEASAQVRPIQQRKQKRDSLVGEEAVRFSPQQVAVRSLFGKIQHGILSASLASSPSFFANQVSVNISGGESGYYSANQVLSLLQNYFVTRKPAGFEFSRFHDLGPAPYATGRLTYNTRGNRESAQVYVSLVEQDSKWVISQLNIY
jgi:hypothetical protein